MATSHVQDVVGGGRTSSGTSLALTVPSGHATTQGNTLIAQIASSGAASSAFPSSITDSQGNLWRVLENSGTTGTTGGIVLAYCHLDTALAVGDVITFTFSTGSFFAAVVNEWAGLLVGASYNGGAAATASATTNATGTLAFSAGVAIGAFVTQNASTFTVGSGWTALATAATTGTVRAVRAEYKILTTNATQTATATLAASAWGSVICVFHELAAITPEGAGSRQFGGPINKQTGDGDGIVFDDQPNLTGSFAFGGIVQFEDDVSEYPIAVMLNASDVGCVGMLRTDSSASNVLYLGYENVGSATGPSVPSGVPLHIFVSKVTGTSTARFHVYNYATGTWTHQNASATLGNPATQAGGGAAIVGSWPGFGDGLIGYVAAVWSDSSSVVSDAVAETLITYDDLTTYGPDWVKDLSGTPPFDSQIAIAGTQHSGWAPSGFWPSTPVVHDLTLTASVGVSSTLKRRARVKRVAVVSATPAMHKRARVKRVATVSASASLKKRARVVRRAVVDASGKLKRRARVTRSASVSASPKLTKRARLTRTAKVSATPRLSKRIRKTLSATVTAAGALSKRIVSGAVTHFLTLTAKVSASGGLTKRVRTTKRASVSATTRLSKVVKARRRAVVGASGQLRKLVRARRRAVVSATGDVVKTVALDLVATVGVTPTLVKRVRVTLSARVQASAAVGFLCKHTLLLVARVGVSATLTKRVRIHLRARVNALTGLLRTIHHAAFHRPPRAKANPSQDGPTAEPTVRRASASPSQDRPTATPEDP